MNNPVLIIVNGMCFCAALATGLYIVKIGHKKAGLWFVFITLLTWSMTK